MRKTKNPQANISICEEAKMDAVELEKGKESRERVWKNLEKILDSFEQDLVKNKKELKVVVEDDGPKSYFNWDVETDKLGAYLV